jgi:hypothetical protein
MPSVQVDFVYMGDECERGMIHDNANVRCAFHHRVTAFDVPWCMHV